MEEVYADMFEKYAKLFRIRQEENLITLVEVPSDLLKDKSKCTEQDYRQSVKTWIAINAMGFYEDLKILYSLVEQFHRQISTENGYEVLLFRFQNDYTFPSFTEGFPMGFKYRLKGQKNANGTSYIDTIMNKLENIKMKSGLLSGDPVQISKFYSRLASDCFKIMLRVYCILISICMPKYVSEHNTRLIISSFKHFYFFIKRYKLVKKECEFKPLKTSRIQEIINIELLNDEYSSYQRILQASKSDI